MLFIEVTPNVGVSEWRLVLTDDTKTPWLSAAFFLILVSKSFTKCPVMIAECPVKH